MNSEWLQAFSQTFAVLDKVPLDFLHGAPLRASIEESVKCLSPELRTRILEEFFGSGPLEGLLADTLVTEIILNGYQTIIVEKQGVWMLHSDRFYNELTFENFVQRLLVVSQLKLDLDHLTADGVWQGFRLHLARAPLVNHKYHVTLRRHPVSSWSLEKLQEKEFMSPGQRANLKSLVTEKKNLLVVGETGCGKTSLLSALLQELPERERVVVLEDTAEVHLPNPSSTRLLTRRNLSEELRTYNLSDLLRESLRMRPERLVVGEVRGEEARDLLLALSTGHKGSLCTLHAGSAKQALARLEFLVQIGAPQWKAESVRELIKDTIDCVLVVHKDGNGRRLKDIVRITSLETFGFTLEKLGQ